MSKLVRWTLAALLVIAGFASGLLYAQTVMQPREFHIVSGGDVGFRIEGTGANGQPLGRLMVRVDGRWLEAGAAPTIRRATE